MLMDDRIIDFNELKNKARSKDVDKFESYIYDLYYSLSQGKISVGDMMVKINLYMQENDISQEKFMNIQKEVMKKYGIDEKTIQDQMKNLGLGFDSSGIGTAYEDLRKTMGFQDKYKSKLKIKTINTYTIENEKNKVEIILDKDKVMIISAGKIHLTDSELNEFLVSYKKTLNEQQLDISLCENVNKYLY